MNQKVNKKDFKPPFIQVDFQITIYGRPLHEKYCDSCDNHDQNTTMIELVQEYDMSSFVER